MPRYAQIDMESGRVISDSFLTDCGMESHFPNLIPIEEEFELFGKKWDFETESWVKYTPEPVEPETPELTQLDRIEENVNKLVTETTVTDVLLGVE